FPTLLVGYADFDLPVEAPATPERGVDGIHPIGRADDHYLAALFEAVHQTEELGDDAAFDVAGGLVALWRDRIELVDEYDRRFVLLGVVEHLAELFFAF